MAQHSAPIATALLRGREWKRSRLRPRVRFLFMSSPRAVPHAGRASVHARHVLLLIHERQRPKTWARAGSAARLNAGSHPIGGRCMLVTSGDGVAEVNLGDGGSRSPLMVRLTACVSARSLRAVSAVLVAAVKAPAKQPSSAMATAVLGARRRRLPLRGAMRAVAKFAFISNSLTAWRLGRPAREAPLHVG
jgi:hypothetical protein